MSIEFNRVRTRNLLDKLNRKQHLKDSVSPSTSSVNQQELVKTDVTYAIVRNIPKSFHSKDLRHYFSEYVENCYFKCFHFRHRPEVQVEKLGKEECVCAKGSRCCLVSFHSNKLRMKFRNEFHLKFWSSTEEDELPSRCYIFCVKLDNASTLEEESLTKKDLAAMIEFHPPSVMPFGNVGTPSDYFLEQIRLCKLPPSLIGKLGLRPTKRTGKYGAVPLIYPSDVYINSSQNVKNGDVAYQRICNNPASKKENKNDLVDFSNTEGLDEDFDVCGEDCSEEQCEEWERYEALHDDVTEQDRLKPKKYEEEMEVTWEKGGPGLVWYTDTFYWNETEEGTDSDWKWADDWNVDYSIYYGKSGCTLDAKQAVEIRKDEKLRSGELEISAFRKKQERSPKKRRYSDSETPNFPIGDFEKHTKGIGSKLLKRYGWRPGKGLGRNESGKTGTVFTELEEAGSSQFLGKKIGFGYHGEKLCRTGFNKEEEHTINTVFDVQRAKMGRIQLENPSDTVLRSKEITYMKYR